MNFFPQYNDVPQSSYYQLGSDDYILTIRQQPRDGLLAQEGKEKNRKPIDPPPFIELTVRDGADPRSGFLVDPYLFVCASLLPFDCATEDASLSIEKALSGSMVSSLHKLKDVDNKDGGFFVFGDLSVKRIGEFKLLFSMFELQKSTHQVVFLRSILSDVFTVHAPKEYPGLEESTQLSRTFQEQGVKLRLRKEARPVGSAVSGRKRSFPFGGGQSRQSTSSSRPKVGPSSTQQTPILYDSSPVVGEPSYGEFPPRQRSDESSPQFSATTYGVSTHGQGTPTGPDSAISGSFAGGHSLYQQRPSAHSPAASQMRAGSQSGWPQSYYARSAGGPMQPLASPQHPPHSAMSMSPYDRAGPLGYSGAQPMMGGGVPQGLAIQVQGTPPTTSSPFQAHQPHSAGYGTMSDSSGQYATYHDPPQYRSDSGAYASAAATPQQPHHSQLPQMMQSMQQRQMQHESGMYADQSIQNQQYADMPYTPHGYEAPGGRASEYQLPSTTRSWSGGQQ